jgi:tetratricopeptide (TPR) repeat protein
LAQSDTTNLDLTLRVAMAVIEDGNAKRAEPWIVRVSDAHPAHVPLLQQKWRVAYQNKSWPLVIDAGEALLAADSIARKDSTFYVRLATAYKSVGRPYKAIETLAKGVAAFPGDGRMYSMWTQYIRAEADTVVMRGLALFPNNADLLALNAKDLRGRGKLQESLDATRRAVALDSTMKQGQLMVAQLEVELGRPDSALVTLRRAIAAGEDSSLVAAFALSKGNALYKAANATRASGDFALSLRYLAFADSVRPSTQSRFLVGAAALGVAQSALTEAPKVADKAESCRLARLGAEMVPVARAGLQAGQDVLPEAAKQSLDYLGTLDPYVTQQIAAFCGTP